MKRGNPVNNKAKLNWIAAVVTLPRNDKERAVDILCGNYPCGALDSRLRGNDGVVGKVPLYGGVAAGRGGLVVQAQPHLVIASARSEAWQSSK